MTKEQFHSLQLKELLSIPLKLVKHYYSEVCLYDIFRISEDGLVIIAAALGLPVKDIWELIDGEWVYFGTDDQFYDHMRCNHSVG